MLTSDPLNHTFRSFALVMPLGLGGCVVGEDAAKSECEWVEVDGANPALMRSDRIAGFSRIRGTVGPIAYVRLSAPPGADYADRIRRIVIDADLSPRSEVLCRTGPDLTLKPGVLCGLTVPGTNFHVAVTYELGAERPEGQTNQIASYIAREVLCEVKWPHR